MSWSLRTSIITRRLSLLPRVQQNTAATMDLVLFVASAAAFRWNVARKASDQSLGNSADDTMTYRSLAQQNASTTSQIIRLYRGNSNFQTLSRYEGDLTTTRDREDDEKLQVGIDFARSKGVIDPKFVPAPYQDLDVLGKTPDQVAQIIMSTVDQQKKASTASTGTGGGVIVLVGLSGTGKGTTMTRLQQLYQGQGRRVVTWSNGNVFRSVTLLAATWCTQNNNKPIKEALTPENLQTLMSMITFGKFTVKGATSSQPQFDIHIKGLGLDYYVSQVQNTVLKSPTVSQNIPTVAQATQGEVILFAADAMQQMGRDGLVVLLEGRAQTVDYVTSPHRFRLVLSEPELIGQRRAAQRLVGSALGSLTNKDASPIVIQQTLDQALTTMCLEMKSQ